MTPWAPPRDAPDDDRPKLNVLTAFPYTTPDIMSVINELGSECRWFLDSGAFTAFYAGEVIALDDYLRFLDALPVRPWRYITLDVITNTEASHANYEAMRARGYDPVPVVTRAGPEVLDLIDAYHRLTDVVALGGTVGRIAKAEPYIKAVMQHCGTRRLHLLGFTRYRWMGTMKPYSADSSSWEIAARYGNGLIYLGLGKWEIYGRKEAAKGPPSRAACQVIRQWGFEPYALRKEENWRGDNSLTRWVAACSWVKAAYDLERFAGTKLFLALSANRADMLGAAWRIILGQARGEGERIKRLVDHRPRGKL